RDLELGRIYLPADDRRTFGDPPLDRPSEELRGLLRFEAQHAVELLAAGEVLRVRIGGRLGRAVALFSRGGLAALDALEAAGWDIFSGRPRPSRARLAREAALVLVRGGARRPTPRSAASPVARRRTSPTGSWCCPAPNGRRSPRSTPSRGR